VSRRRSIRALEKLDDGIRERRFEAPLNPKPAVPLSRDSQAARVRWERAEQRAWPSGARQDYLLAPGGALDQLRQMRFRLRDVDDGFSGHAMKVTDMTKLVN
jgi:hypothetical protein